MRRILVENARRKQRLKRGGDWVRVDFERVELPSPIAVGQLAEFLVMAAPRPFQAQGSAWSRPDGALVIRSITTEILGLKPGQYREDARFVEDSGGG